jgi:RsiW-degrading membrane proteinase PrsW (M82 family)
VRLLAGTAPPIALGAVLLPACAAAILVVVRRPRGVPVAVRVAAFAWGAVGATFLATIANDALFAWVTTVGGEERARALVPLVGGPIVEELTKLLGLVALLLLEPRSLAGVLDGVVCGALVGFGFTVTENVHYLSLAALQGGPEGFERALWVRTVLGGFTHAVCSATAAAGLASVRAGLVRGRARLLVPAFALVLAVLQHVLWNTVAAGTITQILCNPAVPGGACRPAPDSVDLLFSIPLVAAATLLPGAAGLLAVLVWARRRPRGAPGR